MGSTPSTPRVEESSNDPWWPIENQNLELNPNEMDAANNPNRDRIGQQRAVIERTPELASISITVNNNEEDINTEVNNSNSSNGGSESDIANISPGSSTTIKTSENEQPIRHQSLEEFKEELRIKREMRTSAISELRNEISSMRRQLAIQKEANKQLKQERNHENLCQICNSIYESLDGVETNGDTRDSSITLRSHLAEVQFSLQNANSEILTLTAELAATKKQAKSLKEVIAASKEIIEIRETELSQLKSKLKEIENSLAEREMHVMSENLRQEYDRQLANIRNLRALYEERARISAAEKENLNRQLETSRAELSSEVEKNKNLEDHISTLDGDLKTTTTDLYATKEQLAYYKSQNKDLHEEMAVVNQLFGQLLAGFNGNNNIDIDKLTTMLEENRDLLNDITSKENCKEGAAQIPKLLFDLVSHADNNGDNVESMVDFSQPSTSSDETSLTKVTSAQEIIHNLPKVWRVLIELLNHQKLKPVPLKEINQQEHCYKPVETATGTQYILSVSKTYIRLKDLIMEKKFLQKETKKLKNLNSHLECRLDEQEQRLGAVTIELNKTWNLVGRMQRQHRQLHTHEQVLRYQLQQKRRMLNEIKEELEYCRRKWALAKEKNNESQSQWETLRLEFSKRKENDLNNSGESGYSDGPVSETEEDDEDSSISMEKPRNSRMKKKMNIEKFLLTADQKDRNAIRIHSVSPVRSARESVARRNSESHITQFATEVFQAAVDVVETIVQTVCSECGENCVKHSVHFDPEEHHQATDQVKISEPIIRDARHEPTNAQKLVVAKASTSKSKMCCELRKTATTSKPSTSKNEESLEAMFMRLSGSSEAQSNDQCNETQSDDECSENIPSSSQGECEAQRLARIERVAGECKLLMTQVAQASNRGDALNTKADEIQHRYSEVRVAPSDQSQSQNDEHESQPSASGPQKTEESQSKTDAECLTAVEQEYLSRREERLKRLEAESQAYMNRVKSMNTKMNTLRCGSEPSATKNGTSSSDISNEVQPSTSGQEKTEPSTKTDNECLSATEQDYLTRRDERLKRLEAESQAYMERVKSLNRRATDVDSKLEFLHGFYGSESAETSETVAENGNNSAASNTNEPLEESSNQEEQSETSQTSDSSAIADENNEESQN